MNLKNKPLPSWKLVKRDYESNKYTIKQLCEFHGITQSKLYSRIKIEKWQSRRQLRQIDLPIKENKSVLVSRLYQALEKQVASIEQQLIAINESQQMAGKGINREIISRHLAVLAKVLEKLIELEDQTQRETMKSQSLQSITEDSSEIERFRTELKERIEKMLRSKKD